MVPDQSRRTFLRASAATATACVLGQSFRHRSFASSGAKLRVGIIGATGRGDYGHAVDVAFTKIPRVEIVALADHDAQGRAAAAKRTNPKTVYADYHEMLDKEQLQMVAICPRWVDQHHDMITAAAKAGCHVYMEKPFCATLAECDSAVRALQSKNLKLAIAHTTQFSPILDVVKSLINNGEIGDLLELRGRGKEDNRGGGEDLWVLGSHIFGLMRTLAGGNPTSCFATVTNGSHQISKADIVNGPEGIGPLAGDNVRARYTFANGVFGDFASRRGAAGSPSRFAIQALCSKGIVEMETGYLTKATILRDSSWSPGRSGKSWEPITSAGIGRPEPRTDNSYEGGHVAGINNLLDCIEHDRTTKCSFEDAKSIIEMIAAVFESQRVGGPIDVPMKTRVNPLTLLG